MNPMNEEDRQDFRAVAALVAMHGMLSADPSLRGMPDLVADRSIEIADQITGRLEKPPTG